MISMWISQVNKLPIFCAAIGTGSGGYIESDISNIDIFENRFRNSGEKISIFRFFLYDHPKEQKLKQKTNKKHF